MARNLAFLEYNLLFDPGEVWTRVSDLEADFSKFLESKGLQGEIITPVGVTNKRVVFISKLPPPIQAPPTQKNPQDILKKIAQGK